MRVKLYSRSAHVSVVLVALSMAVLAAAETKTNKLARIAIKNFCCINENYYRGAQPQKQDYAALASLGVKTVVDLEREGEADEQELVESNGMKFFRFRMNTSDRPDSQTVGQFLQVVNDPANQPVFVHCHGGRHRTGVMTAIYRLTHDSWTADQAYGEMKQYEFGKGFGHGALKDYVYEYGSGRDRQEVVSGKQSVKASAAGGAKN